MYIYMYSKKSYKNPKNNTKTENQHKNNTKTENPHKNNSKLSKKT